MSREELLKKLVVKGEQTPRPIELEDFYLLVEFAESVCGVRGHLTWKDMAQTLNFMTLEDPHSMTNILDEEEEDK